MEDINKDIETIWKELQEIDKITRAPSTERWGRTTLQRWHLEIIFRGSSELPPLSEQELVIPSWRSADSASTSYRESFRRRNGSLPPRGKSSAVGSSPSVSRYSYTARAPRSTIWDYNFSNGKLSTEERQKHFSFLPTTETKPAASTAEKVTLTSAEGRQSRPRTRLTEDDRKLRNPLKLTSWQHNKQVNSLQQFFYHFPHLRKPRLTHPRDLPRPLELLPRPARRSCLRCPVLRHWSPVWSRSPGHTHWAGTWSSGVTLPPLPASTTSTSNRKTQASVVQGTFVRYNSLVFRTRKSKRIWMDGSENKKRWWLIYNGLMVNIRTFTEETTPRPTRAIRKISIEREEEDEKFDKITQMRNVPINVKNGSAKPLVSDVNSRASVSTQTESGHKKENCKLM